ncbi:MULTISPECIES: DUF3817 domain-containing protein [unclassified Acinetobacter]|uniref:DUF3817 domain-containing protein n=1 Tax=unclassified Acinetobacter TaxID=196816 RepID=UPI0035BB3249
MKIVQALRTMALIECISACLLFFVAMPMKYIFDNPSLIRPVGMAHGILFLMFFVMLLVVCQIRKWPLKMFITGLIASIIPLAGIRFDKEVKKIENID